MSFNSVNYPEIAGFLYSGLCTMAIDGERRVNATTSAQVLAGMFVELSFLFEDPEESLEGLIDALSIKIDETNEIVEWDQSSLPPPNITEYHGELGREYARQHFEEWGDDVHEFSELFIDLACHCFSVWHKEDLYKDQMFRLFRESIVKIMQYEISAQELCDLVIETKMMNCGWSLGDTITSLSGAAGRRLALSMGNDISTQINLRPQNNAQEYLDNIVYVMTQEAIRQGIPAGSDWRLGLAANDCPSNAPKELVDGANEFCIPFFEVVGIEDQLDQAVACAKAAGRMLAVAAGGELPEMSPIIAKPLAMAAMSETYKSVFEEKAIAT